MITGAIIGALLAAGIAITIYHNATSFLGFLLPVTGIAMVGAALGAVVGAVSVSEREDERCPEGMVYVVSTTPMTSGGNGAGNYAADGAGRVTKPPGRSWLSACPGSTPGRGMRGSAQPETATCGNVAVKLHNRRSSLARNHRAKDANLTATPHDTP